MRNVLFYVICLLIAAAPAWASSKKVQNASDDAIAQARAAAAAADDAKNSDSALADEATQSLTVGDKNAPAETATAATKTNDTTATSEESKPLSQDQIKNMKESEIPLATSEKQLKKSESSPWLRLLSTIAVMGVLFGAASIGIKKYGKRSNNSKTQGTKIRVVTNHHLGPKKSLMIVNVAGESLLLGVTDHNITILKNLSLLEEELPADVPKTFAGAINESFVEGGNQSVGANFNDEQADDFAVQGLAQIKDKVSSRLKNMRQI